MDSYGKKLSARDTEGGKFYGVPVANVPANGIFVPLLTSGCFGVAEIAVQAGTLGAFSYVGVFDFERPDGWNSVQGQAVYYTPSSTASGAFSTTKGDGSIFVGWELIKEAGSNGSPIFDESFIRVDIARIQDVA